MKAKAKKVKKLIVPTLNESGLGYRRLFEAAQHGILILDARTGAITEVNPYLIVDVWDALTGDRPYREAWSKPDALKYIREQSGKNFDPQVVEIFLKEFGSE